MAIPVIGWIAIITIAGVAGYSVYQIRLTVKDVTEVFTDETSVLNSNLIQLAIGAAVLFIAYKFTKGKF